MVKLPPNYSWKIDELFPPKNYQICNRMSLYINNLSSIFCEKYHQARCWWVEIHSPPRCFFFFFSKISPKEKNWILKNQVMLEFFNCHEWEEKTDNFFQIFTWFCIIRSKNIEGWIKICTSYLVYNQIWLNLFRDDRHFF